MSLSPIDNLKNLIDRSIDSPHLNNLLRGIATNAILGIVPNGEAYTVDALALFKKKFVDSKIFVEHHLILAELLLDESSDLKSHKEAILQLCNDILIYKNESASSVMNNTTNSDGEYFKDLRGVKCPLNFVKAKLFLDRITSGEQLRIYLDDGAPIENVPRSVRREGHEINERIRCEGYWDLLITKGDSQ